MFTLLESETRLAEAIGLLDDVSLSLLRVTNPSPELGELQGRVRQFVDNTDGLPIAETLQFGQELREAIGRFGFNPAHPIVATAWADFITSLDVIFPEMPAYCTPP